MAMPHESRSTLCSRRELLRAGSLGLFGLTMPKLLAGQEAAARSAGGALADAAAHPNFGRAKSCILLFMWGGPAHQDTWDLKPKAPAEIRGEFQPIDTNVPGIQFCEHFPELSKRADKLAIIRSMTHGDVNHTTSTHFLLTGQPPPGGPDADLAKDWPHMGAVLSRQGYGRGALPPFVSMRPKLPGDVPRFVEQSHGQFAGWLGSAWDPLTIDADPSLPEYRVGEFERAAEVSVDRLTARRRLVEQIEQRGTATAGATSDSRSESATLLRHRARAFDLLSRAAEARAFDLSEEDAATRDRYGQHPHGQSVLQARRLVERGVPMVTVFWPNDGVKNVSVYWDTHSKNFVDLKQRLMPPADQAFSALLDDLADRGLLDETLVVWTGEFGRTPRVGQRNSDAGAGSDGRDHWPGCFTTVLAGAGVPGGTIYGASDRHAAYPSLDPLEPRDLIATIYSLLGINPHLTLPDGQGRPLVVCDGTPVGRLMG